MSKESGFLRWNLLLVGEDAVKIVEMTTKYYIYESTAFRHWTTGNVEL